MKKKIFTLAILLSIIAAAGMRAQNLPGSIWTSPQSTTTEGRYRSNADNFIRPDQYTGVRFDKWFGMVAFNDRGGEEFGGQAIATAGFATKVKSVYIGAFYSGNFWFSSQANNYSERQFTTAPDGGVTGKTYDVYSAIDTSPKPINNAALLIGVADMGFRLTYRTNHQFFNKDDIVIGNNLTGFQLYKNYRSEEGYIAPQIAWAMAKDLTKNGIRPYAALDLVFDRNARKSETAGADASGNSGERIENSENHFDPALSLGLGGYTFYDKNSFRGSFDLDYVLSLNIYDNEYSHVQNNQYKTEKIKGTFRVSGVACTEQFFVSNLLTPSLSGSWSREKLALRFKLNFPLLLTFEEKSPMDINTSTGKLFREGASEVHNAFSFRPDLRLALQYKIIPDRLTLNTGARIQTTAIYLKTVDSTYYINGNKMDNHEQTRKVHDNSFGGNQQSGTSFVSRFHIGAAFNFTENAWVEAATGVTNAFGNEGAIEIFAEGGLFSFGSILVALKF